MTRVLQFPTRVRERVERDRTTFYALCQCGAVVDRIGNLCLSCAAHTAAAAPDGPGMGVAP